jgi:hypothetical protein
MSIKNFDDFAKNAEAWLPMTFQKLSIFGLYVEVLLLTKILEY